MRTAPCTECYICGSGGSLLHEGISDRLFGVPGSWNIRKCDSGCGLLWLDPMPIESDLHEAYRNYYTHRASTAGEEERSSANPSGMLFEWLRQLWLAALFLRSARRQIETMYVEGMAKGQLLEVGCGAGHLLARLRELGWQVEGQDVDPVAAERAHHASGAKVHVGDLARLALPAESYDAIVMNHVIEHVHDPTTLLTECRRLLKRGGVFVAVTPNPASFGHARFGAAWIHLDPPRHLHLFPPAALAAAATQAGFREAEVWTTPARAGGAMSASLNTLWSGRHKMDGRHPPGRAVGAALLTAAARAAHVWDRSSGEESVVRAVR